MYGRVARDVLHSSRVGHEVRPQESGSAAMTSLLWFVALVIGGVGGALNALLSDHARLLPSVVTLTPGGTRVIRIGIVGNILTGVCGDDVSVLGDAGGRVNAQCKRQPRARAPGVEPISSSRSCRRAG